MPVFHIENREGHLRKSLSGLVVWSFFTTLAIFAEAKSGGDEYIQLMKIYKKHGTDVSLEFERFSGYLENTLAPEIEKDNEPGRLSTEFDIPESIKIQTADVLERYIKSMKKGIEVAQDFKHPQRDEKECQAWMDFFEYGFNNSEKDLAKLRAGNVSDSFLKVFLRNSMDHMFFGAQLAPVMSYCFLPHGQGLGDMPLMREMRMDFEAGKLK